MDPMVFLRAEGEIEKTYLRLVAEAAIELHEQYRKNQAAHTINFLAQSMGAKRPSGNQSRAN